MFALEHLVPDRLETKDRNNNIFDENTGVLVSVDKAVRGQDTFSPQTLAIGPQLIGHIAIVVYK